MPDKTIEYTVHDYDPLNKAINENIRIKRTRSVWGYTRSLALFLVALGIFLILAAYAYHIFKKPHPFQQNEIEQQQSENVNKELLKKNEQIKALENNISELENEVNKNPENQELKKQLDEKTKEAEQVKKEKEEIQKKLEEQNKKLVDGKIIKYNSETFVFESSPPVDGFTIYTRREYKTTNDLLEKTGNYEETCYLSDGNIKFEYERSSIMQSKALNALGLTESQVKSYEKYCQRTK